MLAVCIIVGPINGRSFAAYIEQVLAKLKTLLRKADERTVEATWRRIGSLLDAFSADECASYIRMPEMRQLRWISLQRPLIVQASASS